MSESEADAAAEAAAPSGPPRSVEALPAGGVAARIPEFTDLAGGASAGNAVPMDRFYDVNVTVWAELGRAAMPIGELLNLGEGSVLKLGRAVSEPVDLVAQGVCIARGEVVVVDDCFAVRIKEIEPARKTPN